MRQGTAGGWAKVSLAKIIFLSILNAIGLRCLNGLDVIQFDRPEDSCDGTETIRYSYRLNSSYHPQLPYQKDISALKERSLVIVGAEDEANDPSQYPEVMQDVQSKSIHIVPGVKHLDIVHNVTVSKLVTQWVEAN
jgi:hypothetical protein